MKKILLALALLPSITFSASDTFKLVNRVNIQPSCTIYTNNINFDDFNFQEDNVKTTQLSIICNVNTPYVVVLNPGEHGHYNKRLMKAKVNQDFLAYNVYTDNKLSNIFGDGVYPNTTTVSSTGTGTLQQFSIYFRIFNDQYVTPDNYEDNLTIFLNY